MTMQEIDAAYDKLYPRLDEPDEEGIDLHPRDPGGGVYCSGGRGDIQGRGPGNPGGRGRS